MKKILVFGAAGNIGAYFVDYCLSRLSKEYKVIAIDRKRTSFFEKRGVDYLPFDVVNGDYSKLPADDVHAIVNLVGLLPAYSKEFNPIDYINVNIIGSVKILEYAKKISCDRVLYTQTWSDLAGYWGKETLLKPDMQRKLLFKGDHAFYSITKSMVVDTMQYYKEEFGIKNFVFRLPNVYLYSPRTSYFVDGVERKVGYRYMIEQACSGKDLEMWGDPNAFKDILYVKDLCQMMYKALFVNSSGGVYNAGTGVKTTLREQIQGMIDVFGCNKDIKIIERPEKGSFTSFVMDIEKTKKDLGYSPEYFYKDYLEDYKKEKDLKRFDELWEG